MPTAPLILPSMGTAEIKARWRLKRATTLAISLPSVVGDAAWPWVRDSIAASASSIPSGASVSSYFDLYAEAEANNLVWVAPDGTQDRFGFRFWNATDACCDLYGSGVDDSTYLRDLVEEIQKCVDDYAYIYVFSVENMRNSKLKDVRQDWRHSRFFFGKNKVMVLALGKSADDEYLDGLHSVSSHLHGETGLLFTNKHKKEVIQ